MSQITTSSFHQAGGLDVHEADDGLIIFNPETDRVHHLNSTAGVLFTLCETPQNGKALIDSFHALFQLPESEDQSIAKALENLVKDGVLIELDSG